MSRGEETCIKDLMLVEVEGYRHKKRAIDFSKAP
jgi:hypothetical protein